MADISILSRLINGIQRNVDLSSNTLVLSSLKLGTSELEKADLDTLTLTTDSAAAVDASALHHHDGRYFTESEIGSTANGSAGASLIGVDETPAFNNFSGATVQAALESIDAALDGSAATGTLEAQLVSTSNLTLSGEQTIDGTLTSTSRVLLVGQSAPAENGIYVTAAGAWARSTDLDATAEFAIGRLIVVREGTAKGDTLWANQATVGTVDTTAVDIDQVIDPAVAVNTSHSAGDGSDHQDVIDLVTLSGSAANSTNHGAFGGSTISDTSTTRAALAALETAVELRALDADVIKKDGSVAFTADQAMGSNKLTGLSDGTAAGDAINKGQLDTATNGLAWKPPARLASTADIDLGVASTPNPVDGQTLADGDRILLKSQDDGEENGIYDAVTATDPTTWTRVADMDSAAETSGAAVWVTEGTANGDKAYTQTADNVTLDTTPLVFVEFFGGAALSGGDGIDISSSVISVDLSASAGLKFVSNELAIEPTDFAGTGLEDDGSDNMRLATQGNGIAGGNGSTLSVNADVTTAASASANAILVGANGVRISVDDSSIEGSGAGGSGTETLRVKAGGVTNTMLAGSIADSKLNTITTSNKVSGSAVQLAASSGIKDSTGLAIEPNDFAGTGLSDDGADNLQVDFAPKVEESMTAGETFAANSSFIVRMALSGETAGRIYKADKAAGAADSETNTIYVVGIAQNTTGSGINAGAAIPVVKWGEAILQSSDGTFTGSQDEGLPVYLGAAGAFSVTASSTTDDAVVKVGTVRNVGGSSAIEMSAPQIMGINS